MNEWDVIGRTVAALIAGGAIGLERSYHGRAAGLRTYALVCFGSALLVAAAPWAARGDEIAVESLDLAAGPQTVQA